MQLVFRPSSLLIYGLYFVLITVIHFIKKKFNRHLDQFDADADSV